MQVVCDEHNVPMEHNLAKCTWYCTEDCFRSITDEDLYRLLDMNTDREVWVI